MRSVNAFFVACAGLFLLALSYHLGARGAHAQGQSSSELAAGAYDLNAGDTVPMPRYADGTPALPSECTYAIAGYTAGFSFPSPYVLERVHVQVVADPTTPLLEVSYWNEQGQSFGGRATVTVLAIRGERPTPATSASWGKVKADYRK